MDALFKIYALIAFFGMLQCQSAESETIDVDWCDRESRKNAPHELAYLIKNPVYYRARHGEGASACYFQVQDATEETNIRTTDDRRIVYRFSFDDARRICGRFSATLPTIRDKRELDFVQGLPITRDTIALGAELTYDGKTRDNNIDWSKWRIKHWDDRLQGIEVPPNELKSYPTETDPEFGAFGLISYTKRLTETYWGIVVYSHGRDTLVEVVCKLNLTKFNSLSTTTRRQSGKSGPSTYAKVPDVSHSPSQGVYNTDNGKAKQASTSSVHVTNIGMAKQLTLASGSASTKSEIIKFLKSFPLAMIASEYFT